MRATPVRARAAGIAARERERDREPRASPLAQLDLGTLSADDGCRVVFAIGTDGPLVLEPSSEAP